LRFRNLVTLQSQSKATFTGGCYTVTWGTVGTYWAEVSEKGNEEYANDKSNQKTEIKIIMRAESDILAINKKIHRMVYNGRIIHIKSLNDESNRGVNVVILGEVEEIG
jgi:head-tail adaptor